MKHKPRVIRPYDWKAKPRPFGKGSAAACAVICGIFLAAFATMKPVEPNQIKPRPGDREALAHLTQAMNEESQSDDWLEALQAAGRISPESFTNQRRRK